MDTLKHEGGAILEDSKYGVLYELPYYRRFSPAVAAVGLEGAQP